MHNSTVSKQIILHQIVSRDSFKSVTLYSFKTQNLTENQFQDTFKNPTTIVNPQNCTTCLCNLIMPRDDLPKKDQLH